MKNYMVLYARYEGLEGLGLPGLKGLEVEDREVWPCVGLRTPIYNRSITQTNYSKT